MIDLNFVKEEGNLPFKCEKIDCQNKAIFSLKTNFAYNNLKTKLCDEHLEKFIKDLNNKYEEIKSIRDEEKEILVKREKFYEK